MPFPAPSKPDPVLIRLWAATEPVGGLEHSLPIQPDDKRSSLDKFKRDNKRKPRPESPNEKPESRHPDPGRRIDDYA